MKLQRLSFAITSWTILCTVDWNSGRSVNYLVRASPSDADEVHESTVSHLPHHDMKTLRSFSSASDGHVDNTKNRMLFPGRKSTKKQKLYDASKQKLSGNGPLRQGGRKKVKNESAKSKNSKDVASKGGSKSRVISMSYEKPRSDCRGNQNRHLKYTLGKQAKQTPASKTTHSSRKSKVHSLSLAYSPSQLPSSKSVKTSHSRKSSSDDNLVECPEYSTSSYCDSIDCDDQNLCTNDVCLPEEGQCAYTPVDQSCGPIDSSIFVGDGGGIAANLQTCDPVDGQCKPLDHLVPCIAIVDNDSEMENSIISRSDLWNSFRALYPYRPFCLLIPQNEVGGVQTVTPPMNFSVDPRTSVHVVNHDNGDAALVQDWFELCKLEANWVPFVAIFMTISGASGITSIEASLELFEARLDEAGKGAERVIGSDQNWIQPFMVSFVAPVE